MKGVLPVLGPTCWLCADLDLHLQVVDHKGHLEGHQSPGELDLLSRIEDCGRLMLG